jgi:quinol monooxygenase YgiN
VSPTAQPFLFNSIEVRKMKAKLLIVALLVASWAAWNAVDRTPAQEPPKEANRQQMPDLVKGLKAVPGCLGVETAHTQSGKNVIFAWFKDKKAVEDWYHSDTHQEVMEKFAPNFEKEGPLLHVPDGTGPILVVASLTPADKSHFKEMKIPVSQIAIELYAPLPGGAALGGRLAPDGFKVPHLREYKGTSDNAPKDKRQPASTAK